MAFYGSKYGNLKVNCGNNMAIALAHFNRQ